MLKIFTKMFTWETIVIFYLVLITLFLMTGCASYVSTTVGDHTIRGGFYLSHDEANTNDDD